MKFCYIDEMSNIPEDLYRKLLERLKVKTDTPFCNAIKWEVLSYEKQHGKRPKTLVMSLTASEKLWIELMPFIHRENDMKFENPKDGYRRFMLMDVVVCDIIYGGSFNFAFGD